MRKRIYITVSGNTIQTLHTIAREQGSISRSVDFLVEFYKKHKNDHIAERAADIVLQKMKIEK